MVPVGLCPKNVEYDHTDRQALRAHEIDADAADKSGYFAGELFRSSIFFSLRGQGQINWHARADEEAAAQGACCGPQMNADGQREPAVTEAARSYSIAPDTAINGVMIDDLRGRVGIQPSHVTGCSPTRGAHE